MFFSTSLTTPFVALKPENTPGLCANFPQMSTIRAQLMANLNINQ